MTAREYWATHSIKCEDLKPHIEEWIWVYDQLNDLGNGGGYEALHIRSGISQKTITSIVKGHRKWVRIPTADKLMTAMGKMQAMSELDPTPIVPDRPPSHYYEE